MQLREYYNGEYVLVAKLVRDGVRRIVIDRAWNGPGFMAYSLEKDGTIGITLSDRADTLASLKHNIKATYGDVKIERR